MSRPRTHAVALVGLTAICAVIVLGVPVEGLKVAAAVPLTLVLPGAAVVLAIDPRRIHVRGTARLLWALLASLVNLVAGGLILNYTTELTARTWAPYLVIVVVLAALATLVRRSSYVPRQGVWSGFREALRRLSPGPALGLLLAVLLGAGAIGLSVYSSSTSQQEHFLQLWLIPEPVGAGSAAPLARLGVANYEGKSEEVNVTVSAGGQALFTYQVSLAPGETWSETVARRGQLPLGASLALGSHPAHVVHSVVLATPVKGAAS